jgi:capsular exopolysaccharide synthesis family protein
MSRNFELLQQAEVNLAIPSTTVAVSLPSDSRAESKISGRTSEEARNLEKVSREESLHLVQKVFLTGAALPARMVIFAGLDPGNGCSQICAGAAEMLAANTTGSVCLVEANLRSPSLPEYFGVENHFGLSDCLRKEGPVRDFTKKLNLDNLWLLSCGATAPDVAALLNSERMKARLEELRKEFDYVLIDVPPLNQYADATALGRLTDGMVVVLEANVTRREAATKAISSLRASGVSILGAVLNKRTFPIPEKLYQRL